MSELVWIAVPGGRLRDGKVPLSVAIMPRLTESLGAAGMSDWPATINEQLRPRVLTRPKGSTSVDAPELTVTVRQTARSDVWQRFFGTIAVTPFSPPNGYPKPEVGNTSQHAAKVSRTYQRTAAAVADRETVEAELDTWHEPPPTPPVGGPAPARGPIDFHQAVAMLREHPEMLRLLGLMLDLDVDGMVPSNADHEIAVVWDGSPVPVKPRWTRYDFDGALFVPSPGGDVAAGAVDLTVPGRWDVVTFDVDGGVGKLQGAARSLAEDRAREVAGIDNKAPLRGLPALRSAGLMLTRVGREAQLTARTERGSAPFADRESEILTAEDLVLGYRLDIRPQASDTWRSLHRRNATYRIGDLPKIEVEDEEGWVKPHAVVRDDSGLRTDEVVARWDGWSLSVPRPNLDGSPRSSRRGEPMPYDFEVGYTVVKASLPELHFKRGYQVRVRVADLAGRGLRLRDQPDITSLDLEVYVRYEPVPPPQVVPPPGLLVVDGPGPGKFHVNPNVVGPGGSLERLVIRSEPVAEAFSAAPFEGDPAYPANRSRDLVAPITTFAIAEQHGALRLADAVGLDLVSRAFANGRVETPQFEIDPRAQLPDPAALGVAAAVLAEHGVLDADVHDDRPWEGTWPDRTPKVVELIAGPLDSKPRVRWVTVDDASSPDGAASPRVQVILPPGLQVDVELTSTIVADQIDGFAINRLFTTNVSTSSSTDVAPMDPEPPAAPPLESPTAAQNAVAAGRHPMVSSPRRLVLTHAVRLPLSAASGAATAERMAGETAATIKPTTDPLWGVHVPSTASVDVVASWEEWSDKPEPVPTTANVTTLNIPRGAASLPGLHHDFGDTKHRTVTFKLTSFSRFRDCFASTDDAKLFRLEGALDPVPVLSTARPRPPVVVSTVPAFAWHDNPVAGDIATRTRLGGRLRIELSRPWFTTGEDEAIGVIVWPSDEASLPPELRDQVTWCNRDPIHATPTPPALATESMFTGFLSVADVPLSDAGPTVRVLLYPVFFHEDHWYADVEIPGIAAVSYSPFVRLAVTRFQSMSLVTDELDLRMSRVVTCDLAPVLPDRNLDVRRGDAGLEIKLIGVMSPAGQHPNRVVASLERLRGVPPADHPAELTSLTLADPGFPVWTRVAGATVEGKTNEQLPTLEVPADRPLRLVVREIEDLMPNVSAIGVDAARELADRTVFVDIIDLPS